MSETNTSPSNLETQKAQVMVARHSKQEILISSNLVYPIPSGNENI